MDFSDPIKFRYVQMIADMQSFTKAAEKLYISQPALTKSISKLEQELGVKLFDRSSTPLRLTYAGERYLEGMKNISAMRYQLAKELEEIASLRTGRLVVGIPSTRSQRWLPEILPHFLQSFPGIDLRVLEEPSTGQLEQQLAHGSIDLAIITTLPMMTAGLDYEVICDEQLMIMASPKHPMFEGLDLSGIDLRERVLHYIKPDRLQNPAYIPCTPEQGLARAANQLFERFSIHPRSVMEIANTSTACKLAANNVGFVITHTRSVLTRKMTDADILCCTISDPPLTRSVIVSYKADRPLPPAARLFIDAIHEAVRTTPELQNPVFPVRYDLDR